jgi:hypothetical protein
MRNNFAPFLKGSMSPGHMESESVRAILFHKHGVEAVPETGESDLDAKERAKRVSLDIQMSLLNEMYQPGRVGLKWAEVK